MGQSKIEIADGRAHTDASLGAERAVSDADSLVHAAAALRILDDRIERDRMLADQGLLKYRDRCDRTVSRERSDAPSPNSSVSSERAAADQCKKSEREMTDGILQRERQRSDMAVETERSEHEALRIGLRARRQVTDDQLSTERNCADTTATALGETRSALAQARTEQVRQDDVLAMVAHDLRSPLSVISMRAESLAETTRDAATRGAAEAITLSSSRMARLINDLLDVARIESGSLRIVRQPGDVGVLLLEVRRAYGPMFAARNITFDVDTPGERLEALFDYDRIVQVLSNLLGNAMKFTQAGGTVTLHVERQATQLAFALRDNGPGISQSALPHVFERFWQIENDARRGLGLGLHICENIIRAHGGRIWAESEAGKGATFQFTLPVR
jgi:signal transduction histidine kinase